jgi:outer membrane receptor protein involved in Fe transport
VGGRLDKFSSIDDAVFSPRTTLLLKPSNPHTFRVSFNRAFRAPSYINNHIDTTILNEVNLGALSPALSRYVFPITAVGNPDLKQETMTAYELGYTGVIRNRATLSAAVYWNHTDDGIFFTPVASYTAANPPPGWPLPPAVLTLLANRVPPVVLPSQFTYLNLGTVKDKGIELGVEAAANEYVNVFANYSYQWKPVAEGFSDTEINWPAANRANMGFNVNYGRVLGNLTLNFTDEAFWQDVLDARYAGATPAFTLLSGGVGVRWAGDRLVTSIKINNLANDDIQQHIFGDVIKRHVVGEVRFTY